MNWTERIDHAFITLSKIFAYVGATWILLLVFMIPVDVFLRVFFNSPLKGIPEISSNSVASIAFLMLPWAAYRDSNVRSTVFLDRGSARVKQTVNVVSFAIGAALFLGIAGSGWKPMVTAIRILEYEGEGALRVPTYPVRVVIVLGSLLSVYHCGRKVLANCVWTHRSRRSGGSSGTDEGASQ